MIEASVKLKVGTETMLCAAEGNGPVDALNKALQEALVGQFPVLSGLHLTDYSVRVINNTQETAAKVRVYLEHSFEGEIFGTIGVNVDIIKASWNALVEAYQYVLMQHVEFRDEIQVTGSSLGNLRSSLLLSGTVDKTSYLRPLYCQLSFLNLMSLC